MWIATSWLATGLFFAPAISGSEPKGQKFGVNLLFIALLVIVVGSLVGQWMGIMQKLGLAENFWFGHQGYEYVDIGRFWQIFLSGGIIGTFHHLKFAFWSLNIGLLAMVLLSILPLGLAQTWASITEGLWFARSAEFLQQPALETVRWLRVIGDTIFAAGAIVLVWFVFGLKFGWSFKKT